MLDIKYILNNEQKIRKALESRNFDMTLFDKFFELASQRGQLMFSAQQKKAELSKCGADFIKFKNDKNKLNELKTKISKIKKEQQEFEKKANQVEVEVNNLLFQIPNLPLDEIPLGEDEHQNKVIKCHDKLGRGLVTNVKPHHEIAQELGILDIERGVKLSGSRFVIYKNLGAKLTRALESFLLDLHTKNNYEEYAVPVIVKPEILFGTGQLPKFEEDLFKLTNGMYLIPTAEVPVTNIYNNEIIDLSKPLRFTAYTECFRSEAGSGGRDTKGIIRMHQFKKVELVKLTNANDAIDEYNQMLEQAKLVLEELELPYRELLLCTGDLGFSSRKTVDLEVWLPSEIQYREISSVSYMGDFQGRRAKIRYRNENGQTEYAHTMNGSGLAIDRLIAAILENYQNSDGSVSIPTKLIPYMGVDKIIKQ
ncbi:serine--tRNA ligase [Mycoplasmopsis lipofaciens]|uniref:serine--tRNA ligase n=1 Tax=Mycoplasmopsis lipofaciens TaxID=114884 RepID=UPI0004895EAA|nr:serine--tRNA ligase [Mycoplasmopsis lipofaciens]